VTSSSFPGSSAPGGRLAGRRAIITGAARGIGYACVRRLLEDGASVLLVDIDAEGGKAAVARLSGDNQQKPAHFHAADLTQPALIDGIVEAAIDTLGGVDILINSAGVAPRADFFALSLEDYQHVMAINLTAPFLLTQAAARRMKSQGGGGAVLNLSSVAAVVNLPDRLGYCVSKGGLNQLTRNCALALAPFGIRVNAIGPGTIETELVTGSGLTPQALTRILSRTPLGRLGQPEEIAALAAFLVSDDASYVTGQIVYADGGRLGLNYMVPVTMPDT
jgi:glucose 1-dehydrogenase